MDNPVPKLFLNFYTLIIMPFFISKHSLDLSSFDLSSLPEGTSYNNLPMGSGLYAIICLKKNKFYVGETKNICARVSTHWSELLTGIHFCKELQSDWITFGQENFVFVCLCVGPEWADVDVRKAKEKKIISANTDKVYNTVKVNKKNPQYCRRVQYQNTFYPSIAAASRALNVSPSQISRNISDARRPEWQHFSEENSLVENIENIKNAELVGMKLAVPVKIDGVVYRSIKEAARQLNIQRNSIRQRLQNPSFSNYEYQDVPKNNNLQENVQPAKLFDGGTSRPVKINGLVYSSLKEAVGKLNISLSTIQRRLKDPQYPNYEYFEK
jgi:group I intron endonuclease